MHRVTLDLRVHSMEAVKKAAYRFGGGCHASLKLADEHHVVVELRPRDLLQVQTSLASDFELAVLDEGLRADIAKQTEAVRNLIIAAAFSKTSLLDPEGEDGRIEDDPLGILDSVGQAEKR